MKILTINKKKGELRLTPEDLDDLWLLSKIIDANDTVRALTERKIKLNAGSDRKPVVVKKKVILEINVEKVEFHKYTGHLRVSGTIKEGKNDISAGSYHTIDIELNKEVFIKKKQIYNYIIEKLKKSSEGKNKVLICTLDRENAIIFELKPYGFEIVSKIKGEVKKKDFENQKTIDFFKETINLLVEKSDKYDRIIIACPEFWQKYITEHLNKTKIKDKTSFATINTIGINGIKEVLKRPELKEILKFTQIAEDEILINELLKNIKQDGNAVYGFKETKNAAQSGAVKVLMVSENLINKKRLELDFEELKNIMNLVENINGKVHIISSENSEILDGLGGIAAITRYKISDN